MSLQDLPPAVLQQITTASGGDTDFLAQLNSNPELLAQVLKNYDTELSALSDESAMAEQLRNPADTQGVQAGNQFVAASPLSHIANAGGDYLANRRQKELIDQKRGIGQQQNQQAVTVADLLRGSGSTPLM